ncbi:hypothetical protein DVH24_008186 [Malus domestica]|uniref:Uncharacterized protein n=1 Tax=Malus domestica TaxID=3750 RepID=A0A498JKV6_MALDO|nr:hypothetical protein DVH24_008186 [Malus domestica]
MTHPLIVTVLAIVVLTDVVLPIVILASTVNAYGRHVFLYYKSPEAWPLRVEGSESDPLPKFFACALKARKNDFTVKMYRGGIFA